MPRSSELSDFEKGIIIGYHKCGRSLRGISSDLKYPKSTVANVIKKWKVSGDCRNVPRVGRPTKLGDRDRRVLTREICKNRTRPKSVKDLLCLLQAEWKKIPLAVIQRLVESMPRRVHAVIASRGGSTNC
ncbi:transposable element Tc1 transposase [Caerostris darwini]|uniref:Transposable element Tc1 transposase n=1 Tax=Caerostris darwini TaxID=1538125 RepID=A0AAV4SKI0_9ARAC|nr:transposable element Tc1 transposase [Caerostris darwini]